MNWLGPVAVLYPGIMTIVVGNWLSFLHRRARLGALVGLAGLAYLVVVASVVLWRQ